MNAATPPPRRVWTLRHIVAKLASLTLGAAYVSAPSAAVRSWFDRKSEPPQFAGRTALVAHAYYPDLAREILACHARLPAGADLIITAPPDRIPAVAEAFRSEPRTEIVSVPNRGRDVWPFVSLLNAGRLDAYDFVLKLHTKRSPHLLDGDIRRKLLFSVLAGSRRQVSRVIRQFDNAGTGLVGWRRSWRTGAAYWMLDRPGVEGLAERMGFPPPAALAFFEGSMFWVRPAALHRLKAAAIQEEDFEPEAGQIDGALHHAIERIFTTVAHIDGYDIRDAAGQLLQARAPDSA